MDAKTAAKLRKNGVDPTPEGIRAATDRVLMTQHGASASVLAGFRARQAAAGGAAAYAAKQMAEYEASRA